MHPSSSSISARSASPLHRSAAQHQQSMANSPDLARHRHPTYPYPGQGGAGADPYGVAPDAKDPYLRAQPPYGSAYSNGGYRPRSPGGGGAGGGGEQGTLSGLLSTLYRQAQATFSAGPSNANAPFSNLNGGSSNGTSSSSSFLPKLSSTRLSASGSDDSSAPITSFLPSASTVGFILLCSLWYLSSAFSSNTGKSILTRFRYPVTLTFVQFAFVAGYSLLILFLRDRFGGGGGGGHGHALGGGGGGLAKRRGSMTTLGGWGVRKPSRSMFHGTFMMSLFQIAGHVFSSMAIARVPVSTVHTIKALSPLFTVLSYAALFGVRYTPATYTALLPLTLGVMLACSFNIRANAVGFLCALGSTFIFVAQNIFSKKLLPKENKDGGAEERVSGGGGASAAGGGAGGGGAAKLDKLNLLFYSSGMAFFLMIPIWLYSDATTLFFSPPLLTTTNTSSSAAAETSTSTLLFYFFLNGTVHFAQNLLAFSLLARTSLVTYSIASLVKRIAVICIAIVWSHQQVSRIQAVGMSMTFGGLWMYNRAKGDVDRGEKRRAQAEKRAEMSLPTTLGDARVLDGTDTPPNGGGEMSISVGPGGSHQHHGGEVGALVSPTSSGFASNGHSGPPPPPPPHHSAYSVHPDDPYGNGTGGGARIRQSSQGTVGLPPSSSSGGSSGGGGGGHRGIYR